MRKLIWAAAAVVVLLVVGTGVWAASSVFDRELVYDLNRPEPPGGLEKIKRAIAFQIGELVLPLILDESTKYAAGYSEEAFWSLEPGTSEEEVLRSLGEPLSRRSTGDGRLVLYYSEQVTSTDNYRMRNLVLDERGRLLQRRAEFYVD
jgi:hypothetical protein